jgi:hypothetical protein
MPEKINSPPGPASIFGVIQPGGACYRRCRVRSLAPWWRRLWRWLRGRPVPGPFAVTYEFEVKGVPGER